MVHWGNSLRTALNSESKINEDINLKRSSFNKSKYYNNHDDSDKNHSKTRNHRNRSANPNLRSLQSNSNSDIYNNGIRQERLRAQSIQLEYEELFDDMHFNNFNGNTNEKMIRLNEIEFDSRRLIKFILEDKKDSNKLNSKYEEEEKINKSQSNLKLFYAHKNMNSNLDSWRNALFENYNWNESNITISVSD